MVEVEFRRSWRHALRLESTFTSLGAPLMPVRHRHTVLLTLLVLCGLGGCSGNYKFNDDTYRPLGDPQAVSRGK